MSSASASKTGGQLSVLDQKKRFGRITGSNCGGLLGLSFKSNEKNENGWGPTASKIFQLYKMDKEGQRLCTEGNQQELVTVEAVKRKLKMPDIVYPCECIEDEEYCFIASTPDALTDDPDEGGFEFKYKSKSPEKPLKQNRDVPFMHKSQCMLNMRVAKRKWWQLYIRNATQLIPYHINPSVEELRKYWDVVMPIYERFYQQCLRWYWERDISQSFVFVELMKTQGHADFEIEATLSRIETARHPPVVNGRFVQATLSRQPRVQHSELPSSVVPPQPIETQTVGNESLQTQTPAVPQQTNASPFSLPTPELDMYFQEENDTTTTLTTESTPKKDKTVHNERKNGNRGALHDVDMEDSDGDEDPEHSEQRTAPVARNLQEQLASIQVTPPQPPTWKQKQKSTTPASVLPSKHSKKRRTSPEANLSTKRSKPKTTATDAPSTRRKASGSTILTTSRTTRTNANPTKKPTSALLDSTDKQIDDWIGNTSDLLSELD